MDKIKLAIVCHFSNPKVREHLPLDNRKLYSIVRRILLMPNKGRGYGDIAPWDSYMVEQLRQRDDIELYVISAHTGLKRGVCSFELEGVHYHFVRCDRATLLKRLIPSPSLWHKLNPMRPVIRRLVKKISPDIIALMGTENAYYSGTVLGIEGIPIIIKLQTIYNNPDRAVFSTVDKKNAYVERLLLKSAKYVSAGAKMHYRLVRQMNPNVYNFKWSFGYIYPDVHPEEKKFDFVNFAMAMDPRKGFPDSIQALAIVKKEFPNVTLDLVGGGTKEYKEELIQMVESLGLHDNVTFTPFFEKQEDMFQHIQSARFVVLPCKMDSVSGTMVQAMHYGFPMICYRTAGTPKLNENKECVLIAENSNVEDLAEKMLLLLRDPQKANELSINAREYSSVRWDDNDRIRKQMVDNFRAVIENYRNGTPIPEDLLCDEKK
ncbi:MAG: glycosyltransferase family 4 protein [Bacteroidaceae bacterium]|nr:glycosyltransferase family 4 protein [Bacteroidaceae bacterium]